MAEPVNGVGNGERGAEKGRTTTGTSEPREEVADDSLPAITSEGPKKRKFAETADQDDEWAEERPNQAKRVRREKAPETQLDSLAARLGLPFNFQLLSDSQFEKAASVLTVDDQNQLKLSRGPSRPSLNSLFYIQQSSAPRFEFNPNTPMTKYRPVESWSVRVAISHETDSTSKLFIGYDDSASYLSASYPSAFFDNDKGHVLFDLIPVNSERVKLLSAIDGSPIVKSPSGQLTVDPEGPPAEFYLVPVRDDIAKSLKSKTATSTSTSQSQLIQEVPKRSLPPPSNNNKDKNDKEEDSDVSLNDAEDEDGEQVADVQDARKSCAMM
eukprot:c8314_g1_i2.p1 GENE.c8314_g1_i2~~c8314_g1_i2.p1  ORF type:complete len:340 (-),score=72.68 c8314_g1_i2:326-1303(-)